MSKESDFQEILENGINFGRGGGPRKEDDKVKTKAKKKKSSVMCLADHSSNARC